MGFVTGKAHYLIESIISFNLWYMLVLYKEYQNSFKGIFYKDRKSGVL